MSAISRSSPGVQITTRAAKLNIRQKMPRFTIRHRRPKMEVRKKAPVFKIVRSASGARTRREPPVPIVQISRRFTRVHTSNSSNFTERIVAYSTDFGSELENIREQDSIESSALDMIAAENAKSVSQPEALSIEWERGYFEIDWTKNIMEIDWDIDPSPEIYVEPYDIEIYVQNNIRAKARAKALHTFPGTKVDKKI